MVQQGSRTTQSAAESALGARSACKAAQAGSGKGWGKKAEKGSVLRDL